MVDYSKWDNIDISDEEGEDCHPNIDKQSWIKWKKESKELKKKEEEERRKQAEKDYQENLKKISSLEGVALEGDGLKELEKIKAKVKEYEEAKRKEDELRKKYPKWDEKNLYHEGFSKTIINKVSDPKPASLLPSSSTASASTSTSTPSSSSTPSASAPHVAPKASQTPAQPAPAPSKPEELTEEQKKALEEEEENKVNEYVQQMEKKAHKFAASKDFEQFFEAIRDSPEIICDETHQYLLLHSSDFMKKGHDDISKHYLKAACVVNYCLELGKDGVSLFFARMRDSNPKWRHEFETETLAYWNRIRSKYIELGKIQPKETKETKEAPKKTASKIEDDIDD